ncbi:MAG: hypothetical protein Q8Q79_04060 [Sphingopyxis sp.]|nr:hypothetical protein [Sphingopyxis sp.]
MPPMPSEILALVDTPMLLAVGAAIGVGAEQIVEGWKRAESISGSLLQNP